MEFRITPSIELRNHLSTLESDPTSPSTSDICTTIHIDSKSGDRSWIQIYQEMINFQHFDTTLKDEILGEILDRFPVPDTIDLDPGNYVTFPITDFTTQELNSFFDLLMVDYFGATSLNGIHISSESL
ncbi:hypothetical protein JIN85_11130 [Luteolibacter pohnpeiensis]|uniref:Uncharacterized protein n=1 Tax=Luteolibacter pohnpeiensis TaxID=454153 RepID=A0A934S5I6_9BACT|nr:hypothetical protein [Luteolibacter pohnpeiensis]MBK1882971.1 hypothetical protein [Luteolibacter pohnpeiensis]